MEADQGGGAEAGGKGQGGGGGGAQGAGGGGGGGPGGPPGPPGSAKRTPPPRMWRGGRRQGKRPGRRKRGRGERGKRRRGEERRAGEAEGAPRPASPSPEPTPMDWVSGSPAPRQYAPPPLWRGPGTVAGWRAGEVAELVHYVKLAGKTRGRREKRGTGPFSDLVGRAGRPREGGPEMDEGRWRRMLVAPGLSPGEGEEAQGSDAAGAVAAGGVVRGRRVALGRQVRCCGATSRWRP